jgi:SAM-dependent methyltransferase
LKIEKSMGFYILAFSLLFCGAGCFNNKTSSVPSGDGHSSDNGVGMVRASRGLLAPVYAPLAKQIVSEFKLSEKEGIGIDLGSGPGNLIVELCKRTAMHWINADINPSYFADFYRMAEQNAVGQQVSAIYADAHYLPFRNNYADIIVSRGSYHFWEDKVEAFSEIYRVLKPGAPAYIGRGFSKNLPVETAKKIRERQGKKMKYNLDEKAEEFVNIMNELGIEDYRINRPSPPGSENVNYGIWIEFHKPQ